MTNDRLVPYLLVLPLVGFAALVLAEPVAPRMRGGSAQASQPAEELLRHNVSVEFRKAKLGDVIDQLRAMSGANVVIDWNALQQYAVTRDVEVNLLLKDMPVEKVLQFVLDQVSVILGGVTRLVWTIQDNVVLISTTSELSQDLSSRIYDVGDLLEMIGSSRPGSPRDADAADTFRASIIETVEPKSWSSAGGQASIRVLNDQFVVSQSPLGHDAIVRLLADLRKSTVQSNPLWRTVSADFQNARLQEVLQQLTHQANVDLYVNWPILESVGVKPETTVTVRADRVPLGTALQLALDNASRQTLRAGYVFDQGVVIVATQDHLAQTFSAKSQQQKTKETEAQISLVDKMKDTYADPIAAGVVAIGAIKAELQRSGQDVAEGLEALLNTTRAQGLRNALHMTLRDLYAQAGNQQKVMEQLTQMLRENDLAYVTGAKSGAPATQPAR